MENLNPIYGTVIGLDVHLKQVTATALIVDQDGKINSQVRVFRSFMEDLRQMALWCQSLNPDVVCLEDAGVYWVSSYRILYELGLNVQVFNTQYFKKVPGRKKNTSKSQWLAMVVRYGMVKASFALPPDWLDIRSHARYRQEVASDLTRANKEFDIILAEVGIQLADLGSELSETTARQIIERLIKGDPIEEVIKFAGNLLKASYNELRWVLDKELPELCRTTLRFALDGIRRLEATISDLDRSLLTTLKPYQKQLRALQTIPGLGLTGAALLLAEIGPDMEDFETPERIASWVGRGPGNYKFSGKKLSGRTHDGNRWIHRILDEAAQAAVRTESAFEAKPNSKT
jgi:transposase